jgi:hypothetical protein
MAVSIAIDGVRGEMRIFLFGGFEVTPQRGCELEVGPGCAVLADDGGSARDNVPVVSTRLVDEVRSAHAASVRKGCGSQSTLMGQAHNIPGGQDYGFGHIDVSVGMTVDILRRSSNSQKISIIPGSQLFAAQS